MSGYNEGQFMRLDKFLKTSRIIKRRTIANDACDAGKVTVNGKVAKASVNVTVGDIIEVTFGNYVQKVQVTALTEHVRKDEVAGMYKIVDDGN